MGAWGFILSFSLLLWFWNLPYWKYRIEKKAIKPKFQGKHCSLPPWVYVEIKQDNIQVLNKTWFLSFPFHPRAVGAFPACHPPITMVIEASGQLMLGFPEHRKVLTLVQRRHWLPWKFYQNQQVIPQDGVGQTGRCWDDPNSFPPTQPVMLRLLRLGPRSPTARGGYGKCKPQSWEGEGRGGGVSSQCFQDNNLLGFPSSLSGQ